jgi:hypothetical protein
VPDPTVRRSLRTSVSGDLYDQIEWYARVWNISTAKAAERLLAGGAAMWDAIARRELARREGE